ncbi:MAG: 50S ribosomal protein L29 [Candidatus Babeliales bacterium]
MKNKKYMEELLQLSSEQLVERIGALKKELFYLKLKSSTEPIADNSSFRKLIKNIARAHTVMRSKSMQ